MSDKMNCPHCNRVLNVTEKAYGRTVPCPGCNQPISVRQPRSQWGQENLAEDPASNKPISSPHLPESPLPAGMPPVPNAGTGPGADRWHVRLQEGGEEYGPAEKAELDQWVAEGRVTAQAQILQAGSGQWQWASDVYPQLRAQAGGAYFPGRPPDPGRSAASGKQIPLNVSGSPSAGISYRRRNYPAMQVASKMFRIFGWINLVLGILGVGGYLVVGLTTSVALIQAGSERAGFLAMLLTLLVSAVFAVYVAIIVVMLWFLAEAIIAMMDIEDNTHKTTHILQQLQRQHGAPGDW